MNTEDYDIPYDPDKLLDMELWWRDRYTWLDQTGYTLRPRYRPDWKPSWLESKRSRWVCEDGFAILVCSCPESSVRTKPEIESSAVTDWAHTRCCS